MRVLYHVRQLLRRGIPVVDLTCEHPDIKVPRVIAVKTGFCNLAHFTRTFRQSCGTVPSAYRRNRIA